jgi:FkbM family methyltransferase
MSRYVAKVHSFEPYPPVLEKFRSLVALNQITNIEIHPVGLGDEPAELPFFAPPEENLGVGSFVEGYAPDNSRDGDFKLKIAMGDGELGNLGGARVVLIKIDIEGYEKPALRGLARTLAKHRPVVTVELSITPGRDVSFHSREEFEQAFPRDYKFLLFDSARADSATGTYYTDEFAPDFTKTNQREVVAFPAELADRIPRSNRGAADGGQQFRSDIRRTAQARPGSPSAAGARRTW